MAASIDHEKMSHQLSYVINQLLNCVFALTFIWLKLLKSNLAVFLDPECEITAD